MGFLTTIGGIFGGSCGAAVGRAVEAGSGGIHEPEVS
jgi:hypothetical protein